jgi:pyruvate formate lyase activating enzyme
MKIHGLEKMSLVDYDGKVAATVFTGNCNFRCGFCHNSALVLSSNTLAEIPETDIFDYLKKRKGLLDALCITGGEPTLHKDLPLFIEKVKNLGYFVKLDTNGTNPEMVKSLNESGLVDYFAMDVKNDLDSYAEIICMPNFDTKNVKKTIEYFLSGNAKYEFRTTLISEFHKIDNILKIGKLIKGADKYFLQKFKNSENCIQSHLSAVDDKTALEFKELLTEYIPNTFLRGY